MSFRYAGESVRQKVEEVLAKPYTDLQPKDLKSLRSTIQLDIDARFSASGGS